MSLFNTSTGASGLDPQEWGQLVIEPLRRRSLALTEACATQVTTGSVKYHVPIITADATTSWVAEGAEIPLNDPTLNEIVVTPAKCAGITAVSQELANDSDPAAADLVGASIAGSLAQTVDNAFFNNVAAPAPPGLLSLLDANLSRVAVGATTPSNVDAFIQANALVETDNAHLTCWCVNPTDWVTLAKIKTASGWNTPLIGSDVQQTTSKALLGLPVFTSPQITAGVVWGLSAERIVAVLRQDVTVEADSSVLFTSDRIAVKATVRVGFAFATPKAVAKVSFTVS